MAFEPDLGQWLIVGALGMAAYIVYLYFANQKPWSAAPVIECGYRVCRDCNRRQGLLTDACQTCMNQNCRNSF
jgi:hypothetical protein